MPQKYEGLSFTPRTYIKELLGVVAYAVTPAIRRERGGTRTRVYLVLADQPAYPNQISGKSEQAVSSQKAESTEEDSQGSSLASPQMCTYVHTHLHTHEYVHTHLHTHEYIHTHLHTHEYVYYTIWFFKKERQYMRKIEQEEQVEKKQLGSAVVYMYLLMCVEARG